jgi:H+-translocating NAD(P) transhydrogenase subunit alpha
MEIDLFTWLVVVLMLSGIIGYFVVWGVTPALHTPLMAVTNAISGIVVVAAMAVTGPTIFAMDVCTMLPCPYPQYVEPMQWAARLIGFLAVALCAVNIFGGFAITARMLAMYKPKESKKS